MWFMFWFVVYKEISTKNTIQKEEIDFKEFNYEYLDKYQDKDNVTKYRYLKKPKLQFLHKYEIIELSKKEHEEKDYEEKLKEKFKQKNFRNIIDFIKNKATKQELKQIFKALQEWFS